MKTDEAAARDAFKAYAKVTGDRRTWDDLHDVERSGFVAAAKAAADSIARAKLAPVAQKLLRSLSLAKPEKLALVIRTAMLPPDALPGPAETARTIVAWCGGAAERINLVRAAYGYAHLSDWMEGVKVYDLPSVMSDAGCKVSMPEGANANLMVATLRRWCGRSPGRYGSVYRAVQKYHDGKR